MKTKQDVADYFTRCIMASGKTQVQIAEESGFPESNVISMMKHGKLKIPLSRVPALAKSLDVDPREMFGVCLEAYDPEMYELFAALAPSMLVTAKELEVVRALRAAASTGVFAT